MRPIQYKYYLLAVLLSILAFNYVDRLTVGLLLQEIKLDLHLTDTQAGLLSGIAFALFYSVMGLPIARWADRGDRVAIIAITTALWSIVVSLCGLASSFLQLLLIRVVVSVGEAGCVPPAHSLIATHFSRTERPRAVARYMLGNPLSLLIGYFLAGWLNEFYGWRRTFAILAIPGLVMSVLAWLTLNEPRREQLRAARLRPRSTTQNIASEVYAWPSQDLSMMQVCRTLLANATFRHLLIGFSITYFFGYGIGKWQPAFFMRSYGLATGELGTWLAACGLVGAVGMYGGGELAARFAPRNERLQLAASAIAFAASAALAACTYLSPHYYEAFAFLAVSFVTYNLATGPLLATIQTLVPERMRAAAIAFCYLFANLIGMGLGPLAAGALSDALRPSFGEESLRYALLALCPGYLWASWHIWRASRTVARDLAQMDADGEREIRAPSELSFAATQLSVSADRLGSAK